MLAAFQLRDEFSHIQCLFSVLIFLNLKDISHLVLFSIRPSLPLSFPTLQISARRYKLLSDEQSKSEMFQFQLYLSHRYSRLGAGGSPTISTHCLRVKTTGKDCDEGS